MFCVYGAIFQFLALAKVDSLFLIPAMQIGYAYTINVCINKVHDWQVGMSQPYWFNGRVYLDYTYVHPKCACVTT